MKNSATKAAHEKETSITIYFISPHHAVQFQSGFTWDEYNLTILQKPKQTK